MKKVKTPFLLFCLGILVSSCKTLDIYSQDELKKGLEKTLAMTDVVIAYEGKIGIKPQSSPNLVFPKYSNTPIYYSESSIKNEYSAISIVTITPPVFPIFGNHHKVVVSKFLMWAVLACEKQKGDAVLVIDNTHVKIIKFKKQ